MNRITSIDVTELDVTGASETQTVTVDIRRYLPEGVEIFDDNYEVTFTLKIEPLRQRTFTLETNTLIINDIPEQLTYSIQESSVSLTISGLEEDLDQLEANGLKASISLRGLAAGEHKVLVTPILTGGGYGQVGTSQITVTLVDPNAFFRSGDFRFGRRKCGGEFSGSKRRRLSGNKAVNYGNKKNIDKHSGRPASTPGRAVMSESDGVPEQN